MQPSREPSHPPASRTGRAARAAFRSEPARRVAPRGPAHNVAVMRGALRVTAVALARSGASLAMLALAVPSRNGRARASLNRTKFCYLAGRARMSWRRLSGAAIAESRTSGVGRHGGDAPVTALAPQARAAPFERARAAPGALPDLNQGGREDDAGVRAGVGVEAATARRRLLHRARTHLPRGAGTTSRTAVSIARRAPSPGACTNVSRRLDTHHFPALFRRMHALSCGSRERDEARGRARDARARRQLQRAYSAGQGRRRARCGAARRRGPRQPVPRSGRRDACLGGVKVASGVTPAGAGWVIAAPRGRDVGARRAMCAARLHPRRPRQEPRASRAR